MDDEVYSFALRNALDEMQNICPEIENSFMFKESGEIIAGDANTPKEVIVRVEDSFEAVLEKADAIGGVEGVTLEGSKGRVNISSMDELYLVTVVSRKADMKYVNTVTRVLIPTLLKLLKKINPAPLKSKTPPPEIETEIAEAEEIEEQAESASEETLAQQPEETLENETLPAETPVNQLIIENLGGLLVPSDTVRIDSEVLSQWEEFSDGKKIESVEVETFDGKTTKCKVKPIKDSKYKGKGIMRAPEKIQLDLDVRKGELVRVKPIVD